MAEQHRDNGWITWRRNYGDVLEPEPLLKLLFKFDTAGQVRIDGDGDKTGTARLVDQPVDAKPIGRQQFRNLGLGAALHEVEPSNTNQHLLIEIADGAIYPHL
ncbi:hypothetical protein D3C87_1960600 [compost metagenome]